ncbi:hypothetical protein P7C70_g2972, partial [Phenoliferia sp. Uapishka_3]
MLRAISILAIAAFFVPTALAQANVTVPACSLACVIKLIATSAAHPRFRKLLTYVSRKLPRSQLTPLFSCAAPYHHRHSLNRQSLPNSIRALVSPPRLVANTGRTSPSFWGCWMRRVDSLRTRRAVRLVKTWWDAEGSSINGGVKRLRRAVEERGESVVGAGLDRATADASLFEDEVGRGQGGLGRKS